MGGLTWLAAGGAVAVVLGLLAAPRDRLRARTLRATHDAEQKYRALLDTAPDAVFLGDLQSGLILDCNARAEALIGLPRAQIVGMPQAELYPPAKGELYRELFSKDMAEGGGANLHLEVWHRSGYAIPVRIHSSIIHLEGRPVAVGLFRTEDADAVPCHECSFTDSIVDTVQALVMVTDHTGRITRFNRACELLSGYRFDEVRGRFAWELLSPARDVAQVQQAFARLSADGFPDHYQSAWITRGGTERLIDWSNSVVLDEAGRNAYVIATGIDITARKVTEEALRRANDEMEKRVVLRTAALRSANDALVRSEARLAEAQRIAQLGNWEWEIGSGRIFWSDEVFRIFGLEPRAIEPNFLAFMSAIHEDDRERVQRAIDYAVKHLLPYSIDHRIVCPDGRERVVHEQGVVSHDGSAARMVGTVQDITERNIIEEALRHAHDELEERVEARTVELRLANQALSLTQFAVDCAADAVFWMGTDFRLVYVNDAACVLLGYARRELLARGLLGVVGLDAEACSHRLENARQAGALTFESLFRTRSGSLLPVEITANYLEFEGQEFVCLFARDITERRRAEELRHAQLQAAQVLSTMSARFVALDDDLGSAVREGLNDLRLLLRADAGRLLRAGPETLELDWQASGEEACECRAPMDPSRFVPRLGGLREGKVKVLPIEGCGEGAVDLLVPMFAGPVLVGVMAFEGVREVERWREGDFPLLRVAARVITGALQRQRAELQTIKLLEENRRLARQSLEIQETERANLSRELHDELGQCLTAIHADAQSICRLSQGKEPRIYESGKAIGEVASRVYEVVRNIMRRLRPEMLDELGLAQAVRDVVRQWRARHPEIKWSLTVSDSLGTLPEAVQITAFRVIQESITNVIKHAGATRVQVNLSRSSGRLEVLVRDNGHGQNSTGRSGLGLLGMRERVLAVGGRFEVSNQAGQGYRVYALFPVGEGEEIRNAS